MADFWFPDQGWKLIFDFLSLQECGVATQVCKKWRSLVWSAITEVSVPNKFNNEDKFTNSTLVWLTQNCPNLRVLDLSGIMGLSKDGLSSISNLRNLRQISVHRCTFQSDLGFAEALATLDNLQSLNFCRSGINDEFFTILTSKNPSLSRTLTELDVSWTSITRNSYPLLLGLKSLRSLKLNGLFPVEQQLVNELSEQLTRLVNLELRFNANEKIVAPKRDSAYQLQIALANKDNIIGLSKLLRSGDPAQELEGAIGFRKILSIERNPPIQDSIDAGAVPGLIQLLQSVDPFVLLEACWALTNIASGTSSHTRIVVESGGVPISLRLAKSRDLEVVTQAIWFVGNIAGDSYQMRDFVLSHGALPIILEIINGIASTNISLLRNSVWTLSNLARGKPQPEFETVRPCIPTLAQLIYSTDEEVLTDALWALSYLSDGPNERIQAVIEAGVSRRLVELLSHHSYSVQTPALRTIGNIVTGDDMQTQVLLNCSLLPAVNGLLSSPKKAIQKEACWTISNITAGNKTQIQAVIDAQVFPLLSNKLANSEFDVKKEAAWAIANATSGGSGEQIEYLVNLGVIHSFCQILSANDPRIVMVSLEALDNILREGHRRSPEDNPYAGAVEDCGGLDLIEGLQTHQNVEIYEKCVTMLESYFAAAEEVDAMEGAAPTTDVAQL